MTPDINSNPATATRRPGVRGWLLMTPLLAWLFAFVVAPTLIMLVYSFCERDDIGQVVFTFSLDNYRKIFVPQYYGILAWSLGAAAAVAGFLAFGFYADESLSYKLFDLTGMTRRQLIALVAGAAGYCAMREQVYAMESGGNFLRILFISVELAAICTVICALVGYPVAYFLGRASESNRNKLMMLVMIPFWTNFLIRTYAWITILSKEGLLNTFLLSAHIIKEPFDIMPSTLAVYIGTVYTFLPFMILPIYGSVEKLDNSLIEAAFDLGAGPVRAFSNIIVPLTRPGIVAGILLVFIPAVGMFAINDVLGGRKVPLIGNKIDTQFKSARDMPFGAALGIILLLLFAVAFFLTLRKEEKN